ncbi:hypothetical protein V1264_022107 [Littorina saxatilis]|uniref:G-protein coupled receptors family 1 profile domain-containing protein n=1 Tax=Littorina saxatilis TaxID=31220 RepID=A0AAN9FYS3_9CAEN
MTSSHTTDTSSEVISSTINSVFIPWDNPENVMSHETYVKFDDALTCYVVPVLFIMGAGGNLLNCAVFWMQGLKERMNLCLFCLALTDLMYVLFHTVMVSYCVVEKLAASVIDVQYYKWYARRFSVGPMIGFMYSSGCLTTIISVERCLCVTMPMKAASLLKTRTMGLIIGVCVVLMHTLCVQYTLRFDLGYVLDPYSGQRVFTMILSDLYFANQDFFDFVENVILSFFIPFFIVSVATVATGVTVVKLHGTVAWRQNSISTRSDDKDKSLVALSQMLVMVSVIFIVSSLPVMALAIVRTAVAEFSVGGKYANMYYAAHLCNSVVFMVNCCVNVCVYFTRSSRYRKECRAIFFAGRANRRVKEADDTVEITQATNATA